VLIPDYPRQPALTGTYPLLGDGKITAGYPHTVDWVVDNLPGSLAVDIETYGFDRDALRIKCVTLSTPRAVCVLDPRAGQDAELLRYALANARQLIFHNAPYDVPSLARNGLMTLADVRKVLDTLVYARAAWPLKTVGKKLEDLAERLLGLTSTKIKELFRAQGLTIPQGYERMDIDVPAYLMGAGKDGLVTARILAPVKMAAIWQQTDDHPFAGQGLSKDEARAELEKHQIVNRVFLLRTIRGLAVDFEQVDRYVAKNGAAMHDVERELAQFGIDPGNASHLTAYLDRLGAIPATYPRTPKNKQPSGTADNLETLGHPVARRFVHLKQLTKVQGYMEKALLLADEHGRVHPEVQVLKAETGRSSMVGLELHQFPPDARGVIRLDDGGTSTDWSQQEPVIALNVAGDVPQLLEYESGRSDMYEAIARFASIKRSPAKVVLLASMFGKGLEGLSTDLGLDPGPFVPADRRTAEFRNVPIGTLMPQFAAAKALQGKVFESIPHTAEMMIRLKNIAKQHRKIITVNGRVLPIGMAFGRVRAHKGMNSFCQGSAADQYMDTIVEAYHQDIHEGIYLGLHDELITATSIAHDIRKIMEKPSERLIRLSGRVPVFRTDQKDLGIRWAAA